MASAKKGQAVLTKSTDYGGDYRLPKDERRLFWKRHRLAERRDLCCGDTQDDEVTNDCSTNDDHSFLTLRERKMLEVMG